MKKFLNGKSLMLLTILLFPSLLYVVLSTGSHNFIRLPSYGPKTLSSSDDTNYYKVQGIDFFTCSGRTVSIQQHRNNIVLYHFVRNADPLEEKRKASQLIALNDRFKEKKDIKIISVVLGDSIQVCQFQDEYNLKDSSWQVLGFFGDPNWIKEKFILNVPEDVTQKQWQNLFVLVDKKGIVRRYRDAIQYVEEKALIDDIKVLKAEEFIPKKKKKSETE